MTTQYPHSEKIKAILQDKADFVQENGLNYLIPTWKNFANNSAGTEEDLFEWLNDLDTRAIINEILPVLSESERTQVELDLKPLDNLVLEKTFEVQECVWGEKAEFENKYDRYTHWYYYRVNQRVFEGEKGRFTRL